MTRPLRVAVFASGQGTTFDALAEAVTGGHLPVQITLVLSDRPHAPVIERARRRGVPTAVVPLAGVAAELWADRVDRVLADIGVDLIVLAGFLSIVPSPWLRRWAGRVINLHPSLLPRYSGPGMYGLRVHRAVLAAGETQTGASVHLVTEEVDRGPVLAQAPVPVRPGDTPESLRERVQARERELLFSVLSEFADGRWPLPYRAAGPAGARRRAEE